MRATKHNKTELLNNLALHYYEKSDSRALCYKYSSSVCLVQSSIDSWNMIYVTTNSFIVRNHAINMKRKNCSDVKTSPLKSLRLCLHFSDRLRQPFSKKHVAIFESVIALGQESFENWNATHCQMKSRGTIPYPYYIKAASLSFSILEKQQHTFLSIQKQIGIIVPCLTFWKTKPMTILSYLRERCRCSASFFFLDRKWGTDKG